MPCINLRYIDRIDVVALTAGHVVVAGTNALPRIKASSIVVTDVVDAGTEINDKLADGNVCDQEVPCKTLTGKDVEFVNCGKNLALEAILGFASATVASGVTTDLAWGDYNCDAAVAIQVVYKAIGTKSYVELFPNVSAWERTNPTTVDGQTTVKDGFKGRTRKVGGLFTSDGTTALTVAPALLSAWTPRIAAVNAGTAHGFATWVNTSTLPARAADYGCELVALTAGS
jgi:hypothetical protein